MTYYPKGRDFNYGRPLNELEMEKCDIKIKSHFYNMSRQMKSVPGRGVQL
jgi:hypothetical protein